MLRNDYRRSLILLRSNVSGYAGHVRLERRTLMGSMYFVVQSPQDDGRLQAVLIGRGRSGYYACALGELRRDSRQQSSLSISFDPRNICGRELEEYQLAAIVRIRDGVCRIVLFGNLNGYTEIDWERATEAACLLFAQPVPPVNVPPQRPQQPAAPDTPILPTPGLPGGDSPAAPDTPILPTPGLPGGDSPAAPDTPILPTPGLPGGDSPAAPDTPILPTPGLPGNLRQREGEESSAAFAAAERTAAELLDADMSLPWPAELEGLKEIFSTSPALRIAPDDKYVYVSAPMPAMSGYDSCAVGLRTEKGKIVGVSYGLPSLYSAEPPAGLEEYGWAGDNSRGWWVREVELTE